MMTFVLAGFIDFIVYPTFSLLTDMAEKIVIPLVEENPGPLDPCNRHRYCRGKKICKLNNLVEERGGVEILNLK